MKHIIYLVGLLLILNSCVSASITSNSTTVAQTNPIPKNIVLLIGDGTGLSQVSTSFYFKEGPSNFERFPVVGLIKTSSSSQLITDSAAGATAFASGVKTYNGAVGIGADLKEVPTIVEQVSEMGMMTGVVATSSITHATPAAFYSHARLRSYEEYIAEQLVSSDIDFFAGGGLEFFNKREDGKDMLPELEAAGFAIDTLGLNPKNNPKAGFLLANDGMPRMLDDRGDFLPEASEMALELLSRNEKGFFLMIEGSQIDWGGHDNDGDYLISELLDFDKTIGMVLDFAEKNGETLVIVTADHETGGLTLAPNGDNYNEIAPSFSTGGHSATLIPVFAKGPGAGDFGGIYENTEIYHKMKALLGIQ